MGGKILLNILHDAQDREGYLSEETLKKISLKYQIPISKLYGIATFHTMFRTEKQGKHVLELCGSPSCVLNKGRDIEKYLEKTLGVEIGQTTKDKRFSLYKTSCIGCCDEAPAMLVDGKPFTKLTIERVKTLLKELGAGDGRRAVSRGKSKKKLKAGGRK
ncbi:MAG: NAD(P)H-dependent oxidoreductase subunit E [Desulfobacterales bacterium]|nr:NAD(P)H-dependent oxidoreductase subunit E [Desulfobacterales bacterium]